MASPECKAASIACRIRIEKSKTSAERAKILCEYEARERDAGRAFSPATQALHDSTVQLMLTNAETEAKRFRPIEDADGVDVTGVANMPAQAGEHTARAGKDVGQPLVMPPAPAPDDLDRAMGPSSHTQLVFTPLEPVEKETP